MQCVKVRSHIRCAAIVEIVVAALRCASDSAAIAPAAQRSVCVNVPLV